MPGLFGGSKKKSEEYLRKALTYNPQSVITRLFLAETLIELNRDADARKELEAAIAAPDDPEWLPEDRRFREQAKALLEKLRRAEARHDGKERGLQAREYGPSGPQIVVKASSALLAQVPRQHHSLQ